jgi:hypothetical protein
MMPTTRKDPMQQVYDEAAKRLMSGNPDTDPFFDMLKELVMVRDYLLPEDWKSALGNVASVYELEGPK